MSKISKKKIHQHIWKYIGAGYERVCESFFGSLHPDSCGVRQIKHTDQCYGEGWETI